jgi:hypothetical protein
LADLSDQNKSSGSPWDEVLEDNGEAEKPKIFGTLDNSVKSTPSPGGQFKVPSNIPAGVGSKISGENVIDQEGLEQGAGKPAVSQPTPPAANPNQSNPSAPLVPPPPPPKTGGIGSWFRRKPTAPASSQSAPSAAPVNGQVFVNRPPVPNPNMSQSPVVPPAGPVGVNPVAPRPAPVPQNGQATTSQPVPPPPSLPRPPKKTLNLAKPIQEWLARPKVIITAIVIVLLVGLIYVNETGVMATGLEKVYGIFRLESLWGGLPADSQLALAQSFHKMKDTQSLKLDSEIKFTVNKNSDSNITKPLLSLKNPVYIFALDKALLTDDTDSTDSLTDPTTDSPTQDPSADSTVDPTTTDTTTTTPDTSTSDQTTQNQSSSTSATTTPSTGQTDQGAASTSVDSLSTVKEFSSTGKSFLSSNGATSSMEITDESGKKNDVNLYDQSGRLYVNSTGVDYFGSSKGWVYFPLATGSQELLPAVFNQPNLSGFSVTGKRIGSGKFNGEPVYRYQVNIKIGSLLENIGVKDEMVNSITGEIDISKKDQLIRYMELTITPSISSAITRIDLKLAISDYNSTETLTTPENATAVGATATQPAATTPTTTPATTTPTVSADLLARDTQRKADLKSIETALASYYAKYGRYPNSSNQEIQTRTRGNVLSRDLVPTYLASLPVDPLSDKYYYGYKSDGSSYELNAVLGNSSDSEGTMTGSINLYIIRH